MRNKLICFRTLTVAFIFLTLGFLLMMNVSVTGLTIADRSVPIGRAHLIVVLSILTLGGFLFFKHELSLPIENVTLDHLPSMAEIDREMGIVNKSENTLKDKEKIIFKIDPPHMSDIKMTDLIQKANKLDFKLKTLQQDKIISDYEQELYQKQKLKDSRLKMHMFEQEIEEVEKYIRRIRTAIKFKDIGVIHKNVRELHVLYDYLPLSERSKIESTLKSLRRQIKKQFK